MSQIVCMDQVELRPRPKDVIVQRWFWDWNDLSQRPITERQRVLDLQLPGCWFMNPAYNVHSAVLTPAFFWKARDCQADWFRIWIVSSRTVGGVM